MLPRDIPIPFPFPLCCAVIIIGPEYCCPPPSPSKGGDRFPIAGEYIGGSGTIYIYGAFGANPAMVAADEEEEEAGEREGSEGLWQTIDGDVDLRNPKKKTWS